MFGLGVPEVVIIGIVAIVVFGPKRIPELGSALGKTLRSFREEMDNPNADDEEFIDGDEDDREAKDAAVARVELHVSRPP